ncbi:hypothetical protein ABFX02_11G059600 [Erythranthe guttata]
MEYQQPHGYMRPPPPPPPQPQQQPPSAADPYPRPPPPLPPPPSNHPWPYSATQFQYQPQTQHSPSPPPPQWPPPPPPPPNSSDNAQYHQYPLPPPPPPPYSAHQPPPYPTHSHYPPPHPYPPRPPHVAQSYSQDWGNGSWSQHQSWQYPTNNNEEDWAAKARAWAAGKAVTDNQHNSTQFVPAGRPEEQNHFRDQYSQSVDPQLSNYQQYPGTAGPLNKSGLGQSHDSQYISTGQSAYAPDSHVPFAARDGSLTGDSNAPYLQQEKSSISPLVQQQEVPSSYSSVAGNEEAGNRYEGFNSSSSLLQHHVQTLPPSVDRSRWMEQQHHLVGNQPAETPTDLSNQPLSFASHFNRDLDPHVQPSYAHSSGGPVRGGDPTIAISSNYSWAPSSATGVIYPSVPPTIPPGPQVDHPIAMSSPASGHSAPMFPTGPGFQPTVPMMGAAFGVGPGVTPHPMAFSGEAYGVMERPKKASVPNWLREEIIKNKTVITSSAHEIPKEDSQSIEEDINDKYSRKGDQADTKSIDSSRSMEDEDEDEDEVEAARTAAINQEIKRVLTEVLLKVTDELFDEIATKVLNEDDHSIEVGHALSNHQQLPSAPSVLTPKASAKVLIPNKIKEIGYEDTSVSTSGTPGNVLGLASYGTDEEDEEIQSSGKLNSKGRSSNQQSSSSKHFEGNLVTENGGSREETEEKGNVPAKLLIDGTPDRSVAKPEFNDDRAARELSSNDDRRSSERLSGSAEDELQHGSDISKIKKSFTEKASQRNTRPDGNLDARSLVNDDSQIQTTGIRYDKNDRHENKKSSVKKDRKDSESSRERIDKKEDVEHGRHARTERIDYHDISKDKDKEKEKGRVDEKVKNTESRKRQSPSGKEGTTETQRDSRISGRKDNDEKRHDRTGDEKRHDRTGDDKRHDRTRDEKKDRSRHKSGGESSRHKRHRSSSVGDRGRESKEHSVVSRANHSSDESSDDSKRKSHHSKRRKSPSPIRSRKRQVSRSPHSKHSKRRHSPYSSLETTRGKRSLSRSRSPVHRRRK